MEIEIKYDGRLLRVVDDTLDYLSLSSEGIKVISKIEGLEKFVNLKHLNLNCNQISKLEGLDSLVNLKHLFLSDNQISKLEGLDSLVNLKHLFLYNNQIRKIEGLDKLRIEELILSNNPISIKENLTQIISLTTLKHIKIGYKYPNPIFSMLEDIIEQIRMIQALSETGQAITAYKKLQQYSEILGNAYINEQLLIFKKRYYNIIGGNHD